MNTSLHSGSPEIRGIAHDPPRALAWGAILAGTVAALALQIVLMMLGAGLGLAIYNPITNGNPIADFGAGAAVIQGISAVLSLWAGGWVAGRFLGRAGLKGGWLHGFMVWGLTTVVAIAALSTGAGWALGDLSKIVGGGLSMAGRPAAAAVGAGADLAKDALEQNRGILASFVDEGLGNSLTNAKTGDTIRAKRELGSAVTHLFTTDTAMADSNRQAVVTLLVDRQGMSQAAAQTVVEGWSASFQKLKADLDAAKQALETRAREAAEATSKTLAVLSLCCFVAFVLGGVLATWGGKQGGACAYHIAHTEVPTEAAWPPENLSRPSSTAQPALTTPVRTA